MFSYLEPTWTQSPCVLWWLLHWVVMVSWFYFCHLTVTSWWKLNTVYYQNKVKILTMKWQRSGTAGGSNNKYQRDSIIQQKLTFFAHIFWKKKKKPSCFCSFLVTFKTSTWFPTPEFGLKQMSEKMLFGENSDHIGHSIWKEGWWKFKVDLQKDLRKP